MRMLPEPDSSSGFKVLRLCFWKMTLKNCGLLSKT